MPFLRKIAFRFSILDRPNQSHKTHKESVPYLGGLAIVIPITLLSIIGPIVMIENSDSAIRTSSMLLPAVVLAAVGLFDDIKKLSASFRFLIQSLLAICIVFYLNVLGFTISITNNEVIDVILSIFWLVGVTNAFNFFDNLDGGAAGITVIISITLFLLAYIGDQYLISSLALALTGAGLGFLFWNKNPAQIYLGDSGALFIGFFLAVAILQFEPKVESRIVSWIIPIFLMALPIIDTTVAVYSRISKGTSIFVGGQDHLSHRLIRKGMSRRGSAFTLWAFAAIFSVFSLMLGVMESYVSLWISLLGLLLMGFLVIGFLKINSDL